MVRRPRYNTTKSCWTRTRPVRCVVFPWCSAIGFTETGLQKAIWARQISVLRKLGNTDRAVEELSRFVDTFYTDVEAWLELADLYASQHQYVHTRSYLSLIGFCILTLSPQIYLGSAGSVARLGAHTTKPILCATGWGNGVHSSGHPAGHEVLPHGYRDGWR